MNKNKEIVKAIYEKFESDSPNEMFDYFSENIEWITPKLQNAPLGGTRRGIEAVKEFFQLLNDHEEITDFQALEFISEDKRVVVLGSYAATVRSTGAKLNSDWVHIYTVENGKITKFVEFYDNAAADRAYRKIDTARQ